MTHFLDTLPLDFSRPEVRELRDLLAQTYYRDNQVVPWLLRAGIAPAGVDWSQPMLNVWDDVLVLARNQDKLRVLLGAIATGPDVAVTGRLKELMADAPVLPPTSPAGPLEWKDDGTAGDLERIINAESTLLDIAFLSRGVELSRAVLRLLVTGATGKFYGTAFRISDRLVLTNHHVLFPDSNQPATAVEAWFGYERAFDGAEHEHVVATGKPETIVGAEDHDWAVVEIDPFPDEVPIIALTGATPVQVDDRVYIIQHPNGGMKMIGMVHNVVRFVDDDVVQYWTDTEGGSSGSPVFNEQWQLVALHHRWVASPTANGVEYRNQGQRIERVQAALVAAHLV